MSETIQEKADRVLGPDRRDMLRLLHAIADGKWTPQDARDLKAAQQAQEPTKQ